MGKSRKDYNYRDEGEYHTGYASAPSSEDSEASSGSSDSPSSSGSSEDNSSTDQERRYVKRKSYKAKREKRIKRGHSSEEEEEEEPQEKRKRPKRSAEEHPDEWRHHSSTGSGRRKKHHHRRHHHRKHKHKHRRHRHHHSEERGGRGGSGVERPLEGRKGREVEERRGRERTEPERERRSAREMERRERREEKRSREKGRSEARPVRSKWDDEDDTLYDSNRRIKVEPGLEREGSEGWNAEYDDNNTRGRKRKHHQPQQQRQLPRQYQQQQQEEEEEEEEEEENGHQAAHRVKEEPGNRPNRDTPNSTMNSENGRTGWGPGGSGGGGSGGDGDGGDAAPEEEKQKPNLGVTGKLAEDTNTYNGVVIKYSQPSEARKPKRRWRWYIFKGDEELPFLPLHRQSAYLIGRDRKVADIPTDHPSCSKQHAVLQYRLVTYNREDGTKGRTVKPYILDLGSANGTYVNNRRIDSKRFIELLEKDVVKFGYSSREYILLHEGSKGDDEDVPDTGTDLSPVSLLRS